MYASKTGYLNIVNVLLEVPGIDINLYYKVRKCTIVTNNDIAY